MFAPARAFAKSSEDLKGVKAKDESEESSLPPALDTDKDASSDKTDKGTEDKAKADDIEETTVTKAMTAPTVSDVPETAAEDVDVASNSDDKVPEQVLVIPSTRPLFPGLVIAFTLKDKKLISKILQMKRDEPIEVGVFLEHRNFDQKEDAAELNLEAEPEEDPNYNPGLVDQLLHENIVYEETSQETSGPYLRNIKQLHKVGCLAVVQTILPDAQGLMVLCRGISRITLESAVSYKPILTAKIKPIVEQDVSKDEEDIFMAYRLQLLNTMTSINNIRSDFKEQIMAMSGGNPENTSDLTSFARLAYSAAAVTHSEGHLQQEVLETHDLETRLKKALVLLHKEHGWAKLQKDIAMHVKGNGEKMQRTMMLTQQLQYITRELGGSSDGGKNNDVREKYEAKLAGKTLPEAAAKMWKQEMEKLGILDPQHPEFNSVSNWLDNMSQLPWDTSHEADVDIADARRILDSHHYGLDDVKDRIMEFLATSRLLGDRPPGKTLCLVGPPGVGKTSIASSIAEAMGRKMYQFSVGGIEDVHEIRGHRRTYVGSVPGKIITGLIRVGCNNPVILIDEIDKMQVAHRNPSAALLEVLDPEQNNAFVDSYLDCPTDLSGVMFVCTANNEENIPLPLLDRMEVVHLSSYLWSEKMHIAENHLKEKVRKKIGLDAGVVDLEPKALEHLIRSYCREPGVRNLEKHLERIYRKVALRLVERGSQMDRDQAKQHEQTELDKAAKLVELGIDQQLADAFAPTADKGQKEGVAPEAKKGKEEAEAIDVKPVVEGSTVADTSSEVAGAQGDVAEDVDEEDEAAESDSEDEDVRRGSSGEENSRLQRAAKEAERTEKAKKIEERRNRWMEGQVVSIKDTDIVDYVGQPDYLVDRHWQTLPPGVVNGLATRSTTGGLLMVLECVAEKLRDGDKAAGGSIVTTGNFATVMQESTQIAYTVAKIHLSKVDPKNDFFSQNRIHMNAMESWVPKDGPSAGVAMVTALVSLATNTPVRSDMSMTGAITVSSKVLVVGGVREKVTASKRSGCTEVILPESCRGQYSEIPDQIKEGMTVHFVDMYAEVFAHAFAGQQPLATA